MGGSAPLDLANHRFSPSLEINPRLHMSTGDQTAEVRQSAVCSSCGDTYVEGNQVQLPYRVIVTAHRRAAAAASKAAALGRGSHRPRTAPSNRIPALISSRHPHLAPHQFEKLVHNRDPGFLSRSVAVCEKCYLNYVDQGAPSLHSSSPALAPPAIGSGTRQQLASKSAAALLYRPAPQRASAEAANKGKSATSKSWAERDLLYLLGHEHDTERRQGGEFIVPQLPPWVAREIAEMGVASEKKGGLTPQKILDLYSRKDELEQLRGPKDLKALLKVLSP